ncbi:hypothetical protein A2160_05965 [Candidatus Beckwithbacteria bacterium RBG_13_42_9]|uniref:Type II secretion system protein GspF domain-containing protein n=1 Tax=Candidatus Beckwithbacteria bacterium RBG_13_42_9 TaxID=1797457 RepID=A0A1F5E5G4_9BACT|nr:MAG: hypothetical protein A2160_05965 [Candidatus Beckwithbacteria bacterium RBG_13_42_9]
MKKYNYQGRNAEGKKIKGIVEAPGEKEAVTALRQRGLIVFSLDEIGISLVYKFKVLISRVTFDEVVNFTRQLSTMIIAGLPLTDSLSILKDQTNPAMSKVISDILLEVQGGSTLHKALGKYPKVFSGVYLALIRSGEAAGVLDEVLGKMADNLEKQRDFRAKVKGAMVYPAIVIIGMIIVATIMMIFVIPKMLEMYKEFGADLPMVTQILINITQFFNKFWIFLLGFVAAGIYGLKLWRQTPLGAQKFDSLKLKLPIWGVIEQKVILSDVTRTLGMLVGAGVSIIEALHIVADTANNVIYEDALLNAADAVEKGLPLAATIGRYDFFPPILTQMVAVGEETGKLDEVLERVAKHFEAESEVAVKALTTAIEPLMMIVLGIGVGFLVIAIILPIYNLTAKF